MPGRNEGLLLLVGVGRRRVMAAVLSPMEVSCSVAVILGGAAAQASLMREVEWLWDELTVEMLLVAGREFILASRKVRWFLMLSFLKVLLILNHLFILQYSMKYGNITILSMLVNSNSYLGCWNCL